ncbi:hypothetical protein IAR55_005042 [Kwoniella newhampshirensis]|uniref:holo-[acyl-carrier-protein] synthase n=1 Tax=Kwoniella newhampshirensis TaxID=1651941 RepID=A0AAW0YWE8_9TREE
MRLFAIRIPDDLVSEETFDTLAMLVEQPARDRLKRFRLPADSLRSLVARLTLTWYLHTGCLLASGELPTYGRKGKGKPTLTTPILSPSLEFNNTHEQSFILFTILRSHSPLSTVGIDIMAHPSPSSILSVQEGIVDQLTLSERRGLAVPMTLEERARRISVIWALKEGFTKAVGEGITFGMERIEVHLEDQRKQEQNNAQLTGDGDTGITENDRRDDERAAQVAHVRVEKVLVDGKEVGERGWEWRVGEIYDRRKGEEEGYSWAVWWRGEDAEPSARGLALEHVRWDDFVRPLLKLAEDLQARKGVK